MRAAIVTGGGRGLGRAFALGLAEAGWRVAVLSRSADELAETLSLIEQRGGKAGAFAADVSDADAVAKAFASIEESLGPVELLVNNAGVAGPLGPLLTNTIADWWRTLEINLLGQVICAREVLAGMTARRRGRIINIVSGGGAYMLPNFSAYITSKTALIRFSECLAAEVKGFGVSVFAMGPGTVRTAMSEYSLNSPGGRKWLPWFADIFKEGRDLPPERPVELLMALASGKMDALSGCFLRPDDDLERLIVEATEIEREKFYVLQVRRL